MKKIVIYGTCGFSSEAHQLIRDAAASGEAIDCIGFLIDAEYRKGDVVRGLPVFNHIDDLTQRDDHFVVIAIGATTARRRIAGLIEQRIGPRYTVLKHPRSWVADSVAIGEGSIVCAGALASADTILGKHVQLHIGCTVGHDVTIGNFVTIAPGANVSGRVKIGEGVFVGAGAVILPDVEIGPWAMIGAGCVVTKNVPPNATVVGVPSRIIRERESGWHLGK